MSTPVRASFEFAGVTLPLSAIHPIRQVKSADAAFGKYRSILASIREVGVVEPLIVHPQPGAQSAYFLLDGHLRLKALQELGRSEAPCLIAADNDTYTYNDKVNSLSVIQEHAMILRAIEHKVTPEQIAQALDVDTEAIQGKINLLDGVDRTVVELLKNRPIAGVALRLFRRAKAVRQIDMAQLMISANNFTKAYAEALIVGTPPELLVDPPKAKKIRGLDQKQVVRMEREMESLERDYRLHQEQFGENALHLNAVQRYVKRLLENSKVQRFLASRHAEILEEFEALAALESL
ncbi:MAG: plasmid partitioning protein RepB C-terminal domain-containing protein [Opitutaceae bacterium]|nr:plasmid partitioning protein RepB C-terminal domain-containing protein [Opitutaceae bacterium]